MKTLLRILFLIIWIFSLSCTKQASLNLKKVQIGYFANLGHAQAILADHAGDFKNAVAPFSYGHRIYQAGPSAIEGLRTGEIQIAYVGPGPLVSASLISQGKLLRVLSGASANGVVIVARAGSGIQKLADLKGRLIATPQYGNTQDLAARHFLISDLGQNSTSNVLPIPNPEHAVLMRKGKIDAAWVPEPWGQRLVAETGATIIDEEKNLWPEKRFGLAYLVTTPEFLAQYPETVEKVLAVHRQWTEKLQKEKDTLAISLAQAMGDLLGKKVDATPIKRGIDSIEFTNDFMVSSLNATVERIREAGLVRPAVAMETLLVDRQMTSEKK